MRTIRRLALATAALAAGAGAASAQDSPTGVQPYRFTVEGYLASYWLDRGEAGGSRANVGGYGARVMFNRSTASAVARTFFQRASAGVYGTFTTKQDGVSTQNIGAQVDASIFPTAIAGGRLDPFLSLGAGAHRIAGGPDNKTNFVLTPAAGTRIPFFSGIGFRGDLRAPIIFGQDAQLNFLAEGGLYVSF